MFQTVLSPAPSRVARLVPVVAEELPFSVGLGLTEWTGRALFPRKKVWWPLALTGVSECSGKMRRGKSCFYLKLWDF